MEKEVGKSDKEILERTGDDVVLRPNNIRKAIKVKLVPKPADSTERK